MLISGFLIAKYTENKTRLNNFEREALKKLGIAGLQCCCYFCVQKDEQCFKRKENLAFFKTMQWDSIFLGIHYFGNISFQKSVCNKVGKNTEDICYFIQNNHEMFSTFGEGKGRCFMTKNL